MKFHLFISLVLSFIYVGGTYHWQRDRPMMRRKPSMESRLRDDRGGRRERDRIDRSEDQQRGDGNGPNGPNPEEGGYDAFGGQGGVHVPSYSADMNAPPVLMPVPGAG